MNKYGADTGNAGLIQMAYQGKDDQGHYDLVLTKSHPLLDSIEDQYQEWRKQYVNLAMAECKYSTVDSDQGLVIEQTLG